MNYKEKRLAEFDEELFEENGWFKELGNGDEDWSAVKAFLSETIKQVEQDVTNKITTNFMEHISKYLEKYEVKQEKMSNDEIADLVETYDLNND